MTNNLDTLATALYVKTDDLLKASPHLAPWRPAVGIAPQFTDVELVTLAMMQAMLGFASEARWLRCARVHLRYLFPYLPQQPGCNKRLRKAAGLLRRVTRLLAADTGEPERPGAPLFKPLRQVIESVNETIKGQLDLEQHRGRTPGGVIARVMQRSLALTAAIWHNDHTGQPVLRSLTAYDHRPLGIGHLVSCTRNSFKI